MSDKITTIENMLKAAGIETEIKQFPDSTKTAAEAALAIGCDIAQIAKSLVFKTISGKALLVVASGANRVDLVKLATIVGEGIEKADADFVREHTGYAIGGVAPIGEKTVDTYIDQDILSYFELWAAAGTPHSVFRLTPDQLLSLTGGKVVEVKEVLNSNH